MSDSVEEKHDDPFSVDQRVRVYVGTDDEAAGVVVEDFGVMAGHGVDIAGTHIADAARRWAVLLDAGTLVFVDTDQIAPE